MIIQSYNPDLAAEAFDVRDTQVTELAKRYVFEYTGLLHEALSEGCGYDEKLLKLLGHAVVARLDGRHPDLLPMAVRLVEIVEEYVKDVADKDYMGEYE